MSFPPSLTPLCPLSNWDTIENCTSIPHSYIRPNAGVALIPWIYGLILFTSHLPLVLVRVLKWEAGQIWSIAMAAFSVALTVSTYCSTRMQAEKVYVWLPITLVIDVGAMLQVFILIIEGKRGGDGRFLLRRLTSRWNPNTNVNNRNSRVNNSPRPRTNESNVVKLWENIKRLAILYTAAMLFFCLVSLQIVGLAFAFNQQGPPGPLVESWCSPAFQLGTMVYDYTCKNYTVTPTSNSTGCIQIPGAQSQWLAATKAILIIELLIEFIDLVILVGASNQMKFREVVKMKRPWCTMFFGVGVWAALIGLAILQTKQYPHNGQEMVRANGFNITCKSSIYAGGLRGTIIAWSDGVFSSWGGTYYGPSGA
jgi:hypothetical protein